MGSERVQNKQGQERAQAFFCYCCACKTHGGVLHEGTVVFCMREQWRFA